ncbi:MAG: hypothetical protein JHC31_06640 [Sulfurihydrogenibium sp.]|jgi:hypothetical protein|nr:hypothetical protein [Sulfurihydrogenibium sp.]
MNSEARVNLGGSAMYAKFSDKRASVILKNNKDPPEEGGENNQNLHIYYPN